MKKFCTFLVLISVTILFTVASDVFAQKPVKDESLRMGEKGLRLLQTSFPITLKLKRRIRLQRRYHGFLTTSTACARSPWWLNIRVS
jgi:hypothetical protein